MKGGLSWPSVSIVQVALHNGSRSRRTQRPARPTSYAGRCGSRGKQATGAHDGRMMWGAATQWLEGMGVNRVWRLSGPPMMRARGQAQCAHSATAEERACLGPRLCARVQHPGQGANEEEGGGACRHRGPHMDNGRLALRAMPVPPAPCQSQCARVEMGYMRGAPVRHHRRRHWPRNFSVTGPLAPTARPRGRFAPGPGLPRPFWRPWATSPLASTTRWRAGGRQPQRGSARAGGCALHGHRSIASAFGPTPSTRAPGDWTARACCTYRW